MWRSCGRLLAGVALAWMLSSCAGGMPKVPAKPDDVLTRADELLKKGKHLQAVALYQKFLESYVGNERADYAQYKLAEAYLEGEEYEMAAVEYQVLIANYGYSEWVDEALFQTGVCLWRQAPRQQRDQQKSVDALARFSQFLQTYPDHPRAPDARAYVRQINGRLAEKALTSARWYYRRKEPKAALVYCDKVIEGYPDNEWWAQAVYLKGIILVDRGQTEEAIAQFTRLLEYPDEKLKRDALDQIKRARE